MKMWLTITLITTWVTAVVIGTALLWVYQFTPGADARVPGQWPLQSKIPHLANRPTLIMFAHPDCPCTRASIGELAILMTHSQNKVNAWVVFLQPKGSSDASLHTDLWQSAREIPGVIVQADPEGNEAKLFGVTTSGQVVLYGVDKKLLFDGGITPSRGHYGDNDGVLIVKKLLDHELTSVMRTPVFGCSLVGPLSPRKITDGLCTK